MELKQLKAEIDAMFSQAKQDKADAEFYLRILVQAVLTHGKDGFLAIDSSHGIAAQKAAANCRIEFGEGGVRVCREPDSQVDSPSA